MNKMRMFFLLVAVLLIARLSSSQDIGGRIDSLVADTTLSNAHIGLAVYDITADSLIYSHNADRLFSPASNMKLFTSAAALGLLGPGYRFKTGFFRTGKIDKKGRLKGDLVIAGGGDPLISGRFRDSVTEVLELWADSLKSMGIKEIKGDIVTDNSFFSGPELGSGWSWAYLSYWFACPISALSFNDNCVDLKFLPGENVGDPAIIEIDPPTDYITITNNAVTLPADSEFTLDYYRKPYTNDVTFFGGISLSDTAGEIDYVSVHRPELYTAYILAGIIKDKGIKFKGDIVSLDDMEDDQKTEYRLEKLSPLFEWQSDSLGLVISVINKNSQNFFAEQSLKTIGRELGGEGSFSRGIELAEAFFDSIGISSDDIAMRDGSGLSYMNIVKPAAVIKLLEGMCQSPYFRTYYESLAIPGEDRSVRTRLKEVENREHVRAKTGYIANTSSFSGYVDGPHAGHLLAFSIIVNNYSCKTSYVTAWHDSVVSLLLLEY
ncbi:MAG: D-alanyl-D-alanine carboxypeptidase/D-alanyl-D-alanine-endopeptidase [candidate division Zixibacteria bacterium]